MDFSKWKKIFYIVAIISMLLSIKTRVFGATSDYFNYNNVIIDNAGTFIIGNSTIGERTVKLPSFAYDYSNIFACVYANQYNLNTRIGMLILTNGKLFVNDSGRIYGEKNTDYYVYDTGFRNNPTDFSNLTLSNFTKVNNSSDPYWSGYLLTTQYCATALKGVIYDYTNQNDIIIDANPFVYPHFDNVDEIEGGYPEGIYISRGDYSSSDNLYFHLLSVNNTTVPSPGNSVFYYSDNMYELNKESPYYKQWLGDNEEDYSYYYIPRYKLSYDMNTSYVYVLNNSPELINNSYNHIEIDTANGIYDVLESDTTGVMTATDQESDRLKRIEDEAVQQAQNSGSINNALTNTDTDSQNDQDISDNLDFNNNNSALSNTNSGFFSRLVTILNGIIDYDMEEDSTLTFPVPFTTKTITLHSNFLSQNVPEPLFTIIQVFWLFLFNFYLFKFVNKIYIAFSTGNILSGFNSSDEVITNSML